MKKNNCPHSLTKEGKSALENLKNDKSIVVSNSDKGQVVAILNKTNFPTKMEKNTTRHNCFQANSIE